MTKEEKRKIRESEKLPPNIETDQYKYMWYDFDNDDLDFYQLLVRIDKATGETATAKSYYEDYGKELPF